MGLFIVVMILDNEDTSKTGIEEEEKEKEVY